MTIEPGVGIFWWVEGHLVAAGCSLADAASYADKLTYDGGHADHWERWQSAGKSWLAENGLPIAILTSEYDDHPRGRIVFDRETFIVYADRRLHDPRTIGSICTRFGLDHGTVQVKSDPHYRASPVL